MAHEDKKQQILEATLTLIAQQEHTKVSLEAIAERVGLTKTAIYHYFPSKDAVLRATLLREVTRLMSALEEAVTRAKGPEERLRVLVETRFTYLEAWRSRNAFPLSRLFELGLLAMEGKSIIWQSEVNLVAQVLQEGVEKGVFRMNDVTKRAEILVASLRGLDEYFVLYSSSRQQKVTIEQTIEFVMTGVGATAP